MRPQSTTVRNARDHRRVSGGSHGAGRLSRLARSIGARSIACADYSPAPTKDLRSSATALPRAPLALLKALLEEIEGLVDEPARVALGVACDPDVARRAGCGPGCSRD